MARRKGLEESDKPSKGKGRDKRSRNAQKRLIRDLVREAQRFQNISQRNFAQFFGLPLVGGIAVPRTPQPVQPGAPVQGPAIPFVPGAFDNVAPGVPPRGGGGLRGGNPPVAGGGGGRPPAAVPPVGRSPVEAPAKQRAFYENVGGQRTLVAVDKSHTYGPGYLNGSASSGVPGSPNGAYANSVAVMNRG